MKTKGTSDPGVAGVRVDLFRADGALAQDTASGPDWKCLFHIGGDGSDRFYIQVGPGGYSATRQYPAGVGTEGDSDIAADGYFDAGKVVAFLRDLLKHLRGKVVVVWDGGPNHKGPLIRAFLRRNKRLTLERLPAYAPALNPVEAVWSWLKYGQLANYVPDGVPELDDEIADRLIELTFDPGLLRVLWGRSDLPFPGGQNQQPCLPAGQ